MNFGDATARPCNECPWRRVHAPGWLGPLSAENWAHLVLSDLPVACHQTIEESGRWTEGMRQCAGAADFRANIGKISRDVEVVRGIKNDEVFGSVQEFLDHHQGQGPNG